MSCTQIKPVKSLLLMAAIFLFATVKSFAGGDHYEVYLNGKLITKQFVMKGYNALNMQLDKSNYNDDITIIYSHCGETGKSRSVYLKDSKGNSVKEWNFADASGKIMHIKAKDLINAKKNNGSLALFYSAKDLNGDKLLVTINLTDKNTASIEKQNEKAIAYVALRSMYLF